MRKELSPRQERFADEYLVDLNATAAYRRAGYKVRTENAASACAAKLLRNAKVARRIQDAKDRRARRTEITADRVMTEYARIGFADARDYATWGPDGVRLKPSAALDDDAAACVAEVAQTAQGVRFKLHAKEPALRDIAKHLNLLVEQQEIRGTINVQHHFDLSKLSDAELAQLERLLLAAVGGHREGALPPPS